MTRRAGLVATAILIAASVHQGHAQEWKQKYPELVMALGAGQRTRPGCWRG